MSNSKPWIALAAFLAPVIGGSIIYYGLKNKDTELATYGNRASWIAFAIYLVGFFLLGPALTRDPANAESVRLVFGTMGIAGIVLSVVILARVRRS